MNGCGKRGDVIGPSPSKKRKLAKVQFGILCIRLQPVAHNWRLFGHGLLVETSSLDAIEKSYQDVENRLIKVLETWHASNVSPTCQTIISVLKSIDEDVLAEDLGDIKDCIVAPDTMSVEVIDEYQMQLKQTFAILVSTVTEKLEAVDTSVEKIRHHVIHTFPPGNVVSNCKSIGEIFAELSRHKLWNFSTELPRSTFIKGLAETFIKDDPELRKLIDNYRFQLTGFKAMTNIALYIKKCKDNSIANSEQSIQSDIALYDEDYYSELSTKLNARVTERSLLCIDDFWKSIADHFLIPSLSSVLKSIEMGCVEVTWYVPTLSALHIQTKIQSSTKFFQEQKISRVTISSEVLYDEGMSKEDFDDVQLKTKQRLEAALITASKEGNVLDVERLLTVKVNPNVKEMDEFGWTPLLWSCEKGHSDIVSKLIEHDADIDVEDSKKWTGLMLSSRRGYLRIVEELLNHGANVNKQNATMWSSLMWTAQTGHKEVAKLLLERGADTAMRDKAGFTPFLQASQDGHLGIVKLLVEHDKDFYINQRTDTDWSAVMLAVKNSHEDVLRYLVDKGCDATYQREEDEITALHIASYKENNSIVRYLCLKEKLNANIQDIDGFTPLMYAAKKGHLKVVKTLVENGHAKHDLIEGYNKWTALFFAMESRHNDVLDYLLSLPNVNLEYKDKWGQTIISLAQKMNPDALPLFSKHQKAETEAVMKKMMVAVEPVNLKNYQAMLDKFTRRISASPKKELTAGAA